MIVIGIDPGLSGAIALLDHRGHYVAVEDMPLMQRGTAKASVKNQVNVAALAELLREFARDHDRNEITVLIERATPMPAVKPTPGRGKGYRILQGAASLFSLGHSAGAVEATAVALGFRHQLVSAGEWKRALKLGREKEQARAAAIRLFPQAPLGHKRDHNRAEALLIACYGHTQLS